jgi:hypothetical protein
MGISIVGKMIKSCSTSCIFITKAAMFQVFLVRNFNHDLEELKNIIKSAHKFVSFFTVYFLKNRKVLKVQKSNLVKNFHEV